LRASVGAVEGASERADDGRELLENNGLDFDLADLLEDDLFGDLDEDGKSLLDYLDLN